MSKQNKDLRQAKKAKREEQQARRIINWIAGALIVFFLVMFVGYLILFM